MGQYLLKRLVLMAITLFGIALLSFMLVTLAPGDPATARMAQTGRRQGGGLNELTIRKNKEQFNLDLPRLVNFTPSDRRLSFQKAMADLEGKWEAEQKEGKARLGGQIGTASLDLLVGALPERAARGVAERDARVAALDALAAAQDDAARTAAIDALAARWREFAPTLALGADGRPPTVADRTHAWLRQRAVLVSNAEAPARRLLEVLAQVVPATAGGPDVASAPLPDAAAAWATWWTAHEADYAPAKVDAAVDAWLERGDPARAAAAQAAGAELATVSSELQALLAVGQKAAPRLMDEMTDAKEGSERERRAAYALATVCRKTWDLTTSPEERQGYLSKRAERIATLEAAAAETDPEKAWAPDALRRERAVTGAEAYQAHAKAEADLAAAVKAAAAQAGDRAAALEEQLLLAGGKLAGAEAAAGKPAATQADREALAAASTAWSAARGQVQGTAGTELGRTLDALVAARKAEETAADAWVAELEEDELEDQRYFWSDWWTRAEAWFVEFGKARQLVRAFTETQFGRWMSRLVRFDFGESYQQKRPVSTMLKERVGKTITLNVISMSLAFMLAIPLGIFSAVRKDTTLDRIATLKLFILYSLPSFWVGSMLILLFTGDGWLPSHHFESLDAERLSTWGRFTDRAWHLVLPVITLTYAELAYVSRFMRTGLLDVIRQDYIRTARAKGLPEHVVILKHAVRNGLIPILTLLGSHVPLMFVGSVIVEQIFSIDGLGRLAFDAILQRDYPVIMANLVISGVLTLTGYLISDVLYVLVDPRIDLR